MATSTVTPEALKTTIDDIVCVNAFLDDLWGKGGWTPSKAKSVGGTQ